MKIIKRNKQVESFSVEKIKNALRRAFRATETRVTPAELNAL
ncbi:ATP cone domain-containing protein, partial [Porphyromonas sp.]